MILIVPTNISYLNIRFQEKIKRILFLKGRWDFSKMVEEYEDMEFLSPHKCIKETSTREAVTTEHLPNTSRGPWAPKRTRETPT